MRFADDDLRPEEYGTSMHWPYCINSLCTGCLPAPPDLPAPPELDLSIFWRDAP